MLKILLAEPLDDQAEARLTAAAEVVRPPSSGEADLVRAIEDCDALIVRTNTRVSRPLLTAGKKLRVVGVAGVGLDRVDVPAAQQLGIEVLHTPAAASDAVAELAVELMLLLVRPVPRLAGEYRRGRYEEARRAAHGIELRELTVGVLGLGRIGSRVARICAAGLGCRVLFSDIVDVGSLPFPATRVRPAELWAESDILTLHVPLTQQTQRVIDSRTLAGMKDGARLINTARGAIVDTPALVAALESGKLAGAALDVTDPEPLPADHPLFARDNCILTPHIAARTHGGLRRMFDIVDGVLGFLTQG